jgi:hypothetical protein
VDGEPLDARAQAKEEKKLQRTAEERQKQRRAGAFHSTVTQDLLTLFDSRLLGEEEIHGRKA